MSKAQLMFRVSVFFYGVMFSLSTYFECVKCFSDFCYGALPLNQMICWRVCISLAFLFLVLLYESLQCGIYGKQTKCYWYCITHVSSLTFDPINEKSTSCLVDRLHTVQQLESSITSEKTAFLCKVPNICSLSKMSSVLKNNGLELWFFEKI